MTKNETHRDAKLDGFRFYQCKQIQACVAISISARNLSASIANDSSL